MSTENPPRLCFGKYEGRPIRLVPTSYLKWLVSQPDFRRRVRRDVLAELKQRAKKRALENADIAERVRLAIRQRNAKTTPTATDTDGEQ